MLAELNNLALEIRDANTSTNLKHGILICIQEIILLLKNERKDIFESNSQMLEQMFQNLLPQLKTGSYVLKIQIREIGKLIGAETIVSENTPLSGGDENFHPGYFEWHLLDRPLQLDLDQLEDDEDFEMKSRADGFRLINQLSDSNTSLAPYKVVYLMNR